MSNIYLTDDNGEAVVINEVAYHRIGQVVHAASDVPDDDDTVNLGAVDYSDYNTSGNVVTYYVPCFAAVEQLNAYTSEDALTLDADAWEEILASAPDDGQLRIVSDNQTLEIKKNGVLVTDLETPCLIRLDETDSVSVGIQAAAVADTTVNTYFLPDNYPAA